MLQPSASSVTEQIKGIAHRLGFDLVGVASVEPPEHFAFFQNWLSQGYAGQMDYLARHVDRRGNVREIKSDARSVLCVGLIYQPLESSAEKSDEPCGQISRYARGDDYHDLMKARLLELLAEIQKLHPQANGRVYVDTGPVLERDFAARAGLGWFGKHTCLIDKNKGSWFFLGEIILNLALEADAPVLDHCGTCTRCLDACPTDAIVAPYVVDARLCISYLTIELKGAIPRDLRPLMGNWIYGCDICQDVCPWNQKHAKPTDEPAFQARDGFTAPKLSDVIGMDQTAFSETFKGSPIKRTKRRGLVRNAVVALGNVGSHLDVPVLVRALCDAEPLVRGHAAWALGQIGESEAYGALEQAWIDEEDQEVREEIYLAMEEIKKRKERREKREEKHVF